MARTINEIYQSIIVEKNSMPTLRNKLTNEDGSTSLSNEQDLLNDLTTDNKVAIWKLWAYMTAVMMWIHEGLWDVFKADVTTIIDSAFVATSKWLIKRALEFQFGDSLVMDTENYTFSYPTIDTTKQIIVNANVYEGGGRVYLKVRRKDTDLLTSEELTSFSAYINKIKVAGQRIAILNYPADQLKLYFTIYYDGVYPLSTVQSNVEATISNYIENIEFDSILNITTLIDSIQQIEGVKGVEYDNINSAGKADNTGAWITIKNYYNTSAGWNRIADGYSLADTINYVIK